MLVYKGLHSNKKNRGVSPAASFSTMHTSESRRSQPPTYPSEVHQSCKQATAQAGTTTGLTAAALLRVCLRMLMHAHAYRAMLPPNQPAAHRVTRPRRSSPKHPSVIPRVVVRSKPTPYHPLHSEPRNLGCWQRWPRQATFAAACRPPQAAKPGLNAPKPGWLASVRGMFTCKTHASTLMLP